MSGEIKKAQKSWESANQSKDKELSEANHNRSYQPQGDSGRVSEKLNSDASQYKQPKSS